MVPISHLHTHLESDRIKEFQESCEANRFPVVRCRTQKHPVFEEETDFPQHPCPLAGSVATLRGEIVGFINDQQIPRSMGWIPVRWWEPGRGPHPMPGETVAGYRES